MAFEALEKRPEVAPLLVRLYDTHSLYTLAGEKDNSDSRKELTTVMLDLLSIKLSDREQELITDVILSLMKQAEKDLRTALSERIAVIDNIPLRMVLGFANDDIDVAEPVLTHSPILHDIDLAYIFQAKGIEHGRVIAKRKNIGADLIDMLVDTNDFQVAVHLCENDGIKLTEHAHKIYTKMAQNNKRLATPLASRNDVPKDVVEKIYAFVAEDLKKLIAKKHGISNLAMVSMVIDDVAFEMSQAGSAMGDAQIESLLSHAKGLDLVGELKPTIIIANLRRGQSASFVAQFSVFCKLSLSQMKQILVETSGLSLARVCVATGLTKGEFVTLFLLTKKFRGGDNKSADHGELSRIMAMYDGVNFKTAEMFLKNLRN